MTRVCKHTCGAGALLGVLLLAAFAGTALTLHYEARGIVRGQALDRAAGRVFAAWFQAAHRASQDQAAAFAQTLKDGNAIIVTPARLRALGTAPPDCPMRPDRTPGSRSASSPTARRAAFPWLSASSNLPWTGEPRTGWRYARARLALASPVWNRLAVAL